GLDAAEACERARQSVRNHEASHRKELLPSSRVASPGPEGGKVSRAAAASPQLESGNWYLPHPTVAPWVEQFIGECAAFPAGAHDDQVDAWSQGAKRLLLVRPKPVKPPEPIRRTYFGDRTWM